MKYHTVRASDAPEPWDGERSYAPSARCTHKGKTWQAATTGVYNAAIEPAGFAPFYWSEATMIDLDKHATAGEAKVARTLIDVILGSGYLVSVFDGEEWVVKSESDKDVILAAMCSTEEDIVGVRTRDRGRVGHINLIWGNDATGEELIADHSDNETINDLVRITGEKS